MKQLIIKILEQILKSLTEKETLKVTESLQKQALELVDRASEQAIMDLDHVFKSSDVLRDIQKVSLELDKIHEISMKFIPKEISDAIQLSQEICQTVSGLHQLIVTEIKIENERLKNSIKEAKSDEAIKEIMNFTNSLLSGRVSSIAEAFIGGVIKVDK